VIEDAGAIVPVIVPDYKVKLTKDNLSDDINGEAYEAETMYPNFLKAAQLANNQTAYLSLSYAMKTEEKHKAFFEKAFDNLKHGTLNNLSDRYAVCPACGNTYEKAPIHCDFSLTAKEFFIIFK
jgi:rubrerythrin